MEKASVKMALTRNKGACQDDNSEFDNDNKDGWMTQGWIKDFGQGAGRVLTSGGPSVAKRCLVRSFTSVCIVDCHTIRILRE